MHRPSFPKFVFALFVMCIFFPILAHSQSKQVLPGIFKEKYIQFKKTFNMNGKQYTLFFLDSAKNVREEKNIVTGIYLVPDDFSLIEHFGESMNYPPRLKEFIYHDLGDPENKNYCTAILHEQRCDKNGNNSEYVNYEVRLPDDIATEIINLASGDTGLLMVDSMAGMFKIVEE